MPLGAVVKPSISTVNNGQVKEGDIEAVGMECDVSSEIAVKATMAQVIEKFGRIDSLVTSAGKHLHGRVYDAFHW